MNKETEDALCMLLHCSLKDTEYETQVEQYKIVRNYITNLQQENKQLKDNWNELKKWLEENESFDDYCNETTFTSVLEKMLELKQGSDSNEI